MISYKREGSVLHTKSFSFAVRIVKLFKYLYDKDYKMDAIFNQLLRSGTSISANVHESEFAQSSSDFASKLHISLKEANETMNWLNIILETEYISQEEFDSIANDCNELIALLVSSIKTVKGNSKIITK